MYTEFFFELYKEEPMEFLQYILKFFNNILNNEIVPNSFTESIIFQLYKKKFIEL